MSPSSSPLMRLSVVVVVALFLTLTVWWQHIAYAPTPAPVVVITAAPERQPPPSSAAVATACLEGVVTVEPGGRLANQAFEYASAWVVARRFGLRLAVPSAILGPLSQMFANLSAAPLKQLLRENPVCGRITETKALQLGPPFRPNRDETVEQHVVRSTQLHRPLVFSRYIVLTHHLVEDQDSLRREFTFLPEIQRKADTKLAEAVYKVSQEVNCSKEQVCTVGVHVRRTDYWKYMKQTRKLKEEPGAEYFCRAATAMRQQLQTNCSALAFLITSDDGPWCRETLLPALQECFKTGSPPSHAFLMQSNSASADLCLLSSCQHLVMSYGTYGLLAGLLGGGRVAMYDIHSHGATASIANIEMAASMPHWSVIA